MFILSHALLFSSLHFSTVLCPLTTWCPVTQPCSTGKPRCTKMCFSKVVFEAAAPAVKSLCVIITTLWLPHTKTDSLFGFSHFHMINILLQLCHWSACTNHPRIVQSDRTHIRNGLKSITHLRTLYLSNACVSWRYWWIALLDLWTK